MLTATQLGAIAGRPVNDAMLTVIEGLALRAHQAGLSPPHRLAQFLAQIAHESGRFRYVVEVWGPTTTQLRYEGRADLGNTQPGDGFRFRGRTVLQVTGRANYAEFGAWARMVIGRGVPNFTDDPDAMLTTPWAGLAPIWFWETRPALNAAADRGDLAAVTRIVNGGLNGLVDRQALYVRAALVLLGRQPSELREFQAASGLVVDGIAGPLTRAALHKALMALEPAVTAPHPPSALSAGWWIGPGSILGIIAIFALIRVLF